MMKYIFYLNNCSQGEKNLLFPFKVNKRIQTSSFYQLSKSIELYFINNSQSKIKDILILNTEMFCNLITEHKSADEFKNEFETLSELFDMQNKFLRNYIYSYLYLFYIKYMNKHQNMIKSYIIEIVSEISILYK